MFVQQPLAQLDCNPWPYIQQIGYLSLHCDVTAPQTDDSEVLNIIWFVKDRLPAMSNATRIHLGTPKYTGPTSSEDKLNGMKRVNFTLTINNVMSADIGCYWCRIEVRRSNGCSFMLSQSSNFCLYALGFYSNLSNCTRLPGNGTPVCGDNSSFSVQGMNDARQNCTLASQTVVQPVLSHATMTSVSSTAPSPLSLSLVRLRSAPSTAMASTLHRGRATVISYFIESNAPSTAVISALHPEQTATTSYFLETSPLSTGMAGTLHPEQTATISYILHSEADTEPPNNDAITAREDAVRIGLYVGIAVCFVLLAVILVMVVGVILLWRRKPVLTKKPQGRPTLEYNYLNQLNKPCLVKISIKCTSEKYTVHERHFQNTLSHSYLLPITLENMHTIVFFNMNLYCFPSRFKGIFKYALKHILNEEIGRWVMVMCVTCISC